MRRGQVTVLASAVALLGAGAAGAGPAAGSARADAPSWRLEQPAPPAGSPYKVPLGRPGDLECWSATRCLMAVEGNAVAPQGIFFYDGVAWRELSTVCGGSADTTRIAWAGPDEFWTVTAPSLPRTGGGLGLCHFRDGQVIASYSTAPQSPDPFRAMTAAACDGPNDCWFGGVGSQDPSGQRIGAFHLHWDGQSLTSVYAPQGRGVSDVVSGDGRFYETTYVGAQREDRTTPVSLATPEVVPFTIHTITDGRFADAPYASVPFPGTPADGTELLAADTAAGNTPWFVGGGAASGPGAPADGAVARPPIAVRLVNGQYREVRIDDGQFRAQDRFADVAAVPGSDGAWVAVQGFAERGSTTARGRVAYIAADGSTTVDRLPSAGAGRGAAARIEFTSASEGWMVTNAGWVFHFTDGAPRAADSDPAFARLITFRPNESVAQAIPDTPPADDSQLFAPPPAPAPEEPSAPVVKTRHVAALMTKLSKPKVDRKLRLTLAFTLRRAASVQLEGLRKGKLVARSKRRTFTPGRHKLTMQLNRKKWPDRLRFVTHEVKRAATRRAARRR